MDARIWIWVIKNILELSLARFKYLQYLHHAQKSARGHPSAVFEIRDIEQQD